MKNVKILAKQTIFTDNSGNKILYPAICETTNYGLVNFFKQFNRIVSPQHVSIMGNSVTQLGVLRDAVMVAIKGVLYLVDGQHLFTNLSQRGLPVRFKMIDVDNEEDALRYITVLNSSAKNWSLSQFVNSWAHFNENYRLIKEYKAKHNLTIATVAALLCECSVTVAKEQIRNGQVKIHNKNEAQRKIQAIDNFFAVSGFKVGARGIEGLIDYMANIGMKTYYKEEKQFLKNIKLARTLNPELRSFTSWVEYSQLFLKYRKI